MKKRLSVLCAWCIWLCLPNDAMAWGLYAHIAYTHSLLAALPLLPAPLITLMQRYPQWVMTGACLPDLAVVSRSFRHSHGWGIGQQLLQTEDDMALALGIGYNIHLLTDVVAHQHFVPSFEAKWRHASVLTHATAEWAMDAHLYQRDLPMPGQLLRDQRTAIVETLSSTLHMSPDVLNTAVKRLALADDALRFSRIPQGLYYRYKAMDNEFETKLHYYQTQVSLALQELPKLLQGEFPSLHAEQIHLGMDQLDQWRSKCLQDARLRPTRAIRLFEQYHHQWVIQPDC